MTIDIITPESVALDIKDAVAVLAVENWAELLGRLVEKLAHNGTLTARDVAYLLPIGYEVRIND
mgnify:CR=1 FL=1